MITLSFRQTNSEVIVRAAATVLFNALERKGEKRVVLSDLAERPQYGYTASASTEEIGPKFVRITDIHAGHIDWDAVPFCRCPEPNKYFLQPDDLLFARTGATTGKTYLVREAPNAVFASYLIRIRPKPGINAGYLYAFFQSENYWSQIIKEKEGSAQPNMNGQKLMSISLPMCGQELQQAISRFLEAVIARQGGSEEPFSELPAPLAEQRRIVAKIDELAARIEEARLLRQQALEKTELLVQSRINQILEQKVASKSWQLAFLPDFVAPNHHSIKRGPFGSHLRKEFFVPSGYKVYEQKHAIYGDFNAGSYYISEEKFRELKSFEVKADDLIISCSGTIGKVAIVPYGAEPGIINQALLKITLDPSKIDKRFFKLVFESDFIKKEVTAISPGSAMKNIGSVKILKRIKFPLPHLDEQRHIITYLDGLVTKVYLLKRLQAETTAELEAFLPSIFDKSFKGEL